MADVKAENGVLSRTADILQSQYEDIKATIVSLIFSLSFIFQKVAGKTLNTGLILHVKVSLNEI